MALIWPRLKSNSTPRFRLAWLLSLLGIVNKDLLRKGRRYAVIVLLVLAAVITPADPFSMLIAAVPLALLYGISILVCKKKQEEPAAE